MTLNFCLDNDIETDKYVSYVQLMDRDTKQLFYDKLSLVYIELPRFNKKLDEIESFFDLWIFIIKHLHERNNLPEEFQNLPENLQNEIFAKVFEIAKVAKMSKNEVYTYLKSLSDMNIVQNEISRRDRIIAKRDNLIAERDNMIAMVSAERDDARSVIVVHVNALAAKDKEIAEYRRRLGLK